MNELIAAVRAVAAEQPNHTTADGGCRYVLNGQPLCLIGHALWRLNRIDGDFENHSDNDEPARYLPENITGPLTPSERLWVEGVQWEQDKGSAWGDAVTVTDELNPLP